MLLGATLGFGSTQFLEHIHTPTEWIIVACVLVELVQSRKLLIGNDKVCIR